MLEVSVVEAMRMRGYAIYVDRSCKRDYPEIFMHVERDEECAIEAGQNVDKEFVGLL